MRKERSEAVSFNNYPTPATTSAAKMSKEREKRLRQASLAYIFKELLAWLMCIGGLILLALVLAALADPSISWGVK